MKGMSKIKRGVSFKGVSSYVIDRDDPEKEQGEIVGGNMTGTTPEELTEEFEMAHNLRPEIEKPVWHNSLRLPEKEKVSDEKWRQIGDDYMGKMGFSEMHPRVYVKHDDQEGQHIHIVASRVALDGEVYLGRNENLKSTKHIQNLEREHDLTRTKAPEYEKVMVLDRKSMKEIEKEKVVMPEVKQLKKNEIEMAVRKGVKPPKMKVREFIDDALKEKCTAVEFCERLEVVGVKPCPNITKKGKLNGFSFESEGIAFKGSQLGNNYKMAKLQERGLEYEQARDCKELTDRKERFSRELEKDRRVDQGTPSPARSDSSRGLASDRIRSQDEKERNRSDSPATESNERIGDSSRSDGKGEERDNRARSASKPSEKNSADNMGETPSPDSSRNDRSELVRSWKGRFRAVDTTIASAKRERHILRASEKSIKGRNRPLQRDIRKKVESRKGSTRANIAGYKNRKHLHSTKGLGDDFGPSM